MAWRVLYCFHLILEDAEGSALQGITGVAAKYKQTAGGRLSSADKKISLRREIVPFMS